MLTPIAVQAACLGLAFAAATSHAQTPHFTMTLSWTEVIAGTNEPVPNPNSVVDPGEAARISLSISFTPEVGSMVSYQVPPPAGVGRLAGFSNTVFGLEPSNALTGAWSNLNATQGFEAVLWAWPDGTVGYASVGQPYPSGGSGPIPDNPLPDVWQAVWTPDSYVPRLVGFRFVPFVDSPPQVWVETGLTPPGEPWGQGRGTGTFGQVEFSVIPAPPVPGLLLLMLAVLQRKRAAQT